MLFIHFLTFCTLLVHNVVFGKETECTHVYDEGVTNEESELIVNTHNKYREMVENGEIAGQPKGQGLKKLQYDKPLEILARAVSKSCKVEHLIIPDKRWKSLGQNIYAEHSAKYSTKKNWEKAMNAWFNEHTHYDFGKGSTIPKKPITHYTQLVWAATNFVGCDYIFFRNDKDLIRPYTKIYTCNYGCPGNWKGKAPYETVED